MLYLKCVLSMHSNISHTNDVAEPNSQLREEVRVDGQVNKTSAVTQTKLFMEAWLMTVDLICNGVKNVI